MALLRPVIPLFGPFGLYGPDGRVAEKTAFRLSDLVGPSVA